MSNKPIISSGSSIWTVTAIGKDQKTSPRNWGYYFSSEDAYDGMQRSVDTEAGYYKYVVIENFTPGIVASADKELWFIWSWRYDKWIKCKKPKCEIGITSYGMG